jgi:hypothetical protein
VDEVDNYLKIYRTIYNNAKDGDEGITCGGDDNGICPAASLAKNASFEYLLGLDDSIDNKKGESQNPRLF